MGLTIPLIFGAYTAVAIHSPTLSYVGGLVKFSPLWYLVPLIIIGLIGSLGQSTVCIYSNGLDFSSILPRLSRVQATFVLSACGLTFIFLGTLVWTIQTTVAAFVTLFGAVAAPWIAVQLVGHFMRRGYYDPEDLQVFNKRQRGGIYWFLWGFNPRAVVAFLAGTFVALMFLSTTLYAGPWVGAVNYITLSWIFGAVVAAVVYLGALLLFPEPASVYGKGRKDVPSAVPAGAAMDEALVMTDAGDPLGQ